MYKRNYSEISFSKGEGGRQVPYQKRLYLTILRTKHKGEKFFFSRIIVLKVSCLSSLAPRTSTPIIHSRLINICGGPPGKYSLHYRFVPILIFSVHQQPPLVVYYVQSPILSNARRIRPRMTKLNTTAKKCEQSCCVLPIPQYTPISSCFTVV